MKTRVLCTGADCPICAIGRLHEPKLGPYGYRRGGAAKRRGGGTYLRTEKRPMEKHARDIYLTPNGHVTFTVKEEK